MTRGAAWKLALGMLVLLAGEYALLRSFAGRPALARIACRATNAGEALPSEAARVFVHPTGSPWQLVAEGGVGEALELPPGSYDLRVLLLDSADQQSEWLRSVNLAAGDDVSLDVAFSTGELLVTSPPPAAPEHSEIVVYVFSPQDHDRILTSIRPPGAAVLSAGTYDLRAVRSQEFEERGVVWLRDVAVEPGARTSREVRFHRGRLLVRARNHGSPLPSEAVTLTLYAAGDEQQEVVDQGRAGTPLSLEQGRYDVRVTFALSSDRPARWLRDLEIVEDETLERAVEFSSGSVRIDAELAGGEPLADFDVYVYYYRSGDHRDPVAYTTNGETAVLESGRYDARAHFFRSHDRPDLWIRDLGVEAGQLLRRTATFRSGRLLVRAYDTTRHELVGDDVFLYVHDAGTARAPSRPIAVARSGEELVLRAGRYDLRLEDTRTPGREKWLSEVTVPPGGRNELAVSF